MHKTNLLIILIVCLIVVGCNASAQSITNIRCTFIHEVEINGQKVTDTLEHTLQTDPTGIATQFWREWHGYHLLMSIESEELIITLEESRTRRENISAMAQIFDISNPDVLLQQKNNFTGIMSFNPGDLDDTFFSYSCVAFP